MLGDAIRGARGHEFFGDKPLKLILKDADTVQELAAKAPKRNRRKRSPEELAQRLRDVGWAEEDIADRLEHETRYGGTVRLAGTGSRGETP